MSLWRLELTRLVRTRRLHALLGVYALFGFLGPVTTRYLEQILDAVGGTGDAQIVLPPPTMAAGMEAFTHNAAQVGTIVVVIVAAGAAALDALPEMGVFLRTRVRSVSSLLAPRIVVPTAAAASALALGSLAAAYEAVVLLGPVPWASLAAGVLLGTVGLLFVVSLVAAVAQYLRSTLATVMLSLGVLVTLPVLGLLPPVQRFIPTRLLSAVSDLVGETQASELFPATAVALAGSALFWWLALLGASRREV